MNVYRASLLLLSLSFFIFNTALSQGGTWTWMNGDSTINSLGHYGTQGVFDSLNSPPAHYEACEWTDKEGNFWLFGGTYYSDLWKFNPLINQWAWIKGPGISNQLGIYGTQGIPSINNYPGGRGLGIPTWVDTSGNLWLYGGQGYGGVNNGGDLLDDLWKYDITTNEWTWMKGSDSTNHHAYYSTVGVSNSLNMPYGRSETNGSWTDSHNNLWLFGGYGIVNSNVLGDFNDLCKYDISNNEWTWVKGSDTLEQKSFYGIRGIPDTSNYPGSRWGYSKWIDNNNNFWFFGGFGNQGYINDIWRYEVQTNTWTWMGGDSIFSTSTVLSTPECVASINNNPGARFENRACWRLDNKNFLTFGGVGESGKTNSDLWNYNIETNEWTLIKGTIVPSQKSIFGIKTIPNTNNLPGARCGALSWKDNNGNLWLFGGSGGCNDLWRFIPDTTCPSVANLLPVASFQSNDTTICANDCINFTDLSTNNPTNWQWSFAGAVPSSSTAQNPQTICYQDSGSFNVTLIATNSSGSDTLSLNNFITVNPSPPIPLIKQVHNDTLLCSTDPSYIFYEWYNDTMFVSSGATDTFLVVTKSGNYNVKVTNTYCCSIAVGINGWDTLARKGYLPHVQSNAAPCGITDAITPVSSVNIISFFPNPAIKYLSIQLNKNIRNGILKIYNVLGEVCFQSEITNPKSEIDFSSLSQGIYFIEVISEEQRWVGKFVKQ